MAHKAAFKMAAQLCGFGSAVSVIFCILPISHSAMRESPRDAAAHWINRDSDSDFVGGLSSSRSKISADAKDTKSTPIISEAAMERFMTHGILIIDNVLTAKELKSAQTDLKVMLDGKIFELTEQHSEKIRTDSTCLISEPIVNQMITLGTGMRDALRIVRSIPMELISNGSGAEEALYGVPLSNQLSCYNGAGSHYRPHRDTPEASSHPLKWILQAGLNERETTIILYLNDIDWDVGTVDDGCLRCFLGTTDDDETGTTATEILNIAPKGGRLVIFDSKKVLHEVRPTSKQRAAITCWVGGSHSLYNFIRPLCVPFNEIKFC